MLIPNYAFYRPKKLSMFDDGTSIFAVYYTVILKMYSEELKIIIFGTFCLYMAGLWCHTALQLTLL